MKNAEGSRRTGRRSRRNRSIILGMSLPVLATASLARAASGTWNAAPTNGMWEASGAENNWTPNGAGAFPGTTSGAVNSTDVATFTGISNVTNISINSTAGNSLPLNIGGLTFTGANKSAYTIGTTSGNPLWLTSTNTNDNTSTLQIVISGAGSTGTGNIETINSPIVLQPSSNTAAGFYTFQNNSTSSTAGPLDKLVFNGPISGGTTSAGVTLTLRGANTNPTNAINGAITNGGAAALGIVKRDGGVWTLGGNNSYTGLTTVIGGTLNVTGSYSGGGTVDLLTGGATAGLIYASSGTSTFGNVILDGGNAFFIVNSGTASVGSISESALSASRHLDVNSGGILSIRADYGAIPGVLNVNGGTIANGKGSLLIIDSLLTNSTTTHSINIGANGGTFNTTGGSITSLATLNGGGGTVNITGGNTFKAGATLTSVMSVQGTSTWDTNGIASSAAGLSGTGSIANSGAAATLTSNLTTTQTYAGNIAGGANVSFVKSGTGTQILSGTAHTFTGPTSVNAGALIVSGALTTSDVTVNSGASLGGTGDGVNTGKLGNVILAAGGTLAPGASVTDGSVGTLVIGGLDANNGNTRFDLVTPGASDMINAGAATFSASNTFTLVGIPATGTYTLVQSTSALAGVAPTVVTPTGTRATYTSHYADLNPNLFQLSVVGAPKTLTWTGSSSNVWDVHPGTTNWTDGAIAEEFYNLDSVTFDDTGINKNVVLNTTATPGSLTFNNSTGNNYTLAGTGGITGATALTKTGTGTVVLATNNSYGNTTISGGALQVGNGGTSGTLGTGTVQDDAALIFNRSDSTTLTVAVNGTGSLQQAGSGTLVITSSNNYSGTTTINSGSTVQLGDGGATGNFGSTSGITNNGSIIFNRNNSHTLAASISGSGNLLVNSGTLALGANNSYTGTTTINSGSTLQVGSGGTTGSLGTGAVTNNGTLAFNRSDVVTPASFSGGGAIQQNGTGTLVFSGASSFTGPLIVNTGTVAGLHPNAFGSTSGITLAAAGTLSLRGDASTTFQRVSDSQPDSVFFSGSGGTINVDQATGAGTAPKTMTIGPISAAPGFTGPSYTLNFTGANSTGLSVGAINGPAATQGFATTLINNLNTSGTTTIASYTGNNTVGNETVNFAGTGNTVITGSISDPPSAWPLAVSKGGTGTLTLSAASSYSNGTTITSGTVAIGDDNAFGSGAVNVNAPDAVGVLQSTNSTTRTIPNDITNSSTNFTFGGTGNLVFTGAWNKGQFFKNLIVTCPTMTISGSVVSNPGANQGFSKEGLGTLVLAGANTYMGDTIVRQGTETIAPTGSLGDPTFGLEVSNNNTTGPGTNTVMNLSTVSDTTVGSLSGFISAPTSGTNTATINTGGSGLNLIVNQTTSTTAVANIAGAGNLVLNNGGTLSLTGNLTYTGTTTVNSGRLSVGQSFRSSSALVVADGAMARMTPRTGNPDRASSRKTLQVGTLNLNTSGTLDLADNDLVVDNGNFATIKSAVLAGFGTTGPGIISSTSDGSQILALFDNSLIGAGDWNGGTIGAAAIVGKYTYFGDVNFDGQVTGDDYTIIDSNLNTTPPVGLEWLSGDANLDGIVTGDDYTTIDSNLGLGTANPLSANSLGGSLTPSALGAAAVPEPASLAGIIAAGALLLRRRRQA